MFVNDCHFTSVFFKQACHANRVAGKKLEGLGLYISRQFSLNFSKTPTSNNVSH